VSCVDSGDPWHANCYVVRHTASGEQIVIDPGGNGDEILRRLADGLAPAHLLLTHAHHDHVAAAGQLCEVFDRPCRVHPNDAKLLRQSPMYAMRFGNYRMEPPRNVVPLAGETLPFAGTDIQVIPLPGHTAGGVGYKLMGMVFTGDVLLKSAVGRTDLPGGDVAALRRSVTSLLDALDPATILYPGHGAPWTAGEAAAWWLTAASAAPEHRSFGH
jgi:hydroxyacylglutathione hydrolase